MKPDAIDLRVLECLRRDGRMSVRAVAKAIGVPKTVVAERLTKLKNEHVILGFRVVIAPSMLGAECDIIASYILRTDNPVAFRVFERKVSTAPNVTGAVKTGPGAYQIRVASRAALNWIEEAVADCGLVIAEFRIEPIIEEIIPYRDPPLRAPINAADRWGDDGDD